MAIPKEEVQTWLDTLLPGKLIAVDRGGFILLAIDGPIDENDYETCKSLAYLEVGGVLKPVECKLCPHSPHSNEFCHCDAPNAQFRCGCPGPCRHGKHPAYCKECS